MIRSLHDAFHARLMISIWPKMSVRSADRREMRERPGLHYPEGDSPFYDAFNPEARVLHWKQANEGLFSKGIDAWWCDATEPERDGWDFTIDAYKGEERQVGSK
jgi:alpha-D-xyloside xylohydrolase